MAIKVQHDYQVGNGLEIVDNKTAVKPDNTGNVQFEVSETGLKGTVTLPQAFDPSALEQKIQEATDTATVAQTAATEADIKATTATEKNTEQDAEIETLKQQIATLSADAPKTAQEYWDEIKALPTFKEDLLAVLKGEEVQDFAGITKGFLLPEA